MDMHGDTSEISADDEVEAHRLAANVNEETVPDEELGERQKLAGNTNEDALRDDD